MADITDSLRLAKSAPDEAVNNIDDARVINIPADQYKDQKPFYQDDVDLFKRSTEASRGLSVYAKETTEHASFIKDDIESFTKIENILTTASEKFNKGFTIQDKVDSLKSKKALFPKDFTEDDDFELFKAESELNDRKLYNSSEPIKGKHDQLLEGLGNVKDDNSFIEKSYNAILGGVSNMAANVAKTPQLAFDILLQPINQLRRMRGEVEIVAPDSLRNNEVVKYFTEQSNEFYKEAPLMVADIKPLMNEGKYAEVAESLALKILSQTPQLALTLTNPAIGVGFAVGSTSAEANYENQNKGISPTQSLPNALTKGAIEGLGEKLVTINKLKSLELSLINSFGKDSAKKVMKNLTLSVASSAGSEFLEEGFVSIAQDATDYLTGVESRTLDQMLWKGLESAFIGAGSAGLMTTPIASINAKNSLKMRQAEQHAINVLKFDNAYTEALKILDKTKAMSLSEGETALVMEKVFQSTGMENIYLNKEVVSSLTDTPEKAKAITDLLDPSGKLLASLNGPLKIKSHEFLMIRGQFPEVGDQYSLVPDGMSVKESVEFLNKVNKMETDKKTLLEKLATPDATPEEKQAAQEAITVQEPSMLYPSNDFNEDAYLDMTNMDEALKSFMPDKERSSYIEKQKASRQMEVDHINESAEFELDQVVDVQMENVMQAEQEAQLDRTKNIKELILIDRFTNYNPDFDMLSRSVQGYEVNHSKEGYSPFAIDFKSLPSELRDLYRGNERLKKNKVFVPGGQDAQSVASILGFDTVENMLETLSTTQSRQEVAEARTKKREADIREEIRNNTPINETGKMRAYMNRSELAYQTLQNMINSSWSSFKSGVKRIAQTPPSLKVINESTNDIVRKFKIKELKVKEFKVAERRSEKIAIDAILKNNVELAFKNQMNVVKAISFQREITKSIGEVNRAQRFFKKLESSEFKTQLEEAGETYVKKYKEITDILNLTSKRSRAEEIESFNKYVENNMNINQAVYLPESMSDQRTALQDMTVEQVLTIRDVLKQLEHQVKLKNKLQRKYDKIENLQTMEALSWYIDEHLKKNFSYDENGHLKSEKQQIDTTQKVLNFFDNATDMLERSQWVIKKLDNDETNGLMNDLLYRPLVDADNQKKKYISDTIAQFNTLIDKYGRKDFENLTREIRYIPEFKGSKAFPDGRVTKHQLLTMELNFGNKGNKTALLNIKDEIDINTIRKVLDRELDHRATEFAQNVWNMYESFKPKINELNKRTDGIDETIWVKAEPFVARGRLYDGGYYPISYRLSASDKNAKQAQGRGVLNAEERFRQNYYGNTMTDQNHLKARKGSTDILNFSLDVAGKSFNQIIHDLTHREVIADGVKILTNPDIKKSILNTVSEANYNNILNMYNDISDAPDRVNISTADTLQNIVDYVGGGLQVVALGGNVSSIMMQPLSLVTATEVMGKVSGAKYISQTISMLATNAQDIGYFFELAEHINPAISKVNEDIFKNSEKAIIDMLTPTDQIKLLEIRDKVKDLGFTALGQADRVLKVIITLSAYKQAIDGKAPNLENIKDNHEEAVKYASNVSELSQTHNELRNLSPVQKNRYLKYLTMFFNDRNNLFNAMISRSRDIKKKLSDEEIGLIKKAGLAGLSAASSVLTLTIIQTLTKLIRGEELPTDEEKEYSEYAGDVSTYLLTSTIDQSFGLLPMADSVSFAANFAKPGKKINVQTPLDSAISDIATGFSGLLATLNFYNGIRDMSKVEKKSLVKAIGIITHVPTWTPYKLTSDDDVSTNFKVPLSERTGIFKKLSKTINETLKGDLSGLTQDHIQEIKEVKNIIDPQPVQISQKTYDILMEVPEVSKFTLEEWNNLKKDAPFLGLTDNGRESKDNKQREKALNHLAELNADLLKSEKVDVTEETLMSSKLVSVEKTIQIFKGKDDDKLTNYLSNDEINRLNLDKNLTIGEYKNWLIGKTAEAEESLTNKTNK